MPNPIKYSTGSESLALNKGNFYIGTGDVGKGPSDTTGYYQAVSPPNGGYVIYLNNPNTTSDMSYHVANNDSELISFTNNLAEESYTTVNECFTYYAGQNDKMVVNSDYKNIVTDGMVLNLDANFIPSYPKNGTTWYDVSTNTNDGTLTNGPTFNPIGGITFDGTDDIVDIPTLILTGSFSITQTMNLTSTGNGPMPIGGGFYASGSNYRGYVWFRNSINKVSFTVNGESGVIFSLSSTKWVDKNISYTVTRDGTTAKLYLNGVEEDSSTISTNNFDIRTIGASYNYPAYSCDGTIYSTKIYGKALSQSEILQNYYQAPIVTDGLVLAMDAGNLVSYESGSTTTYSLTGSISGSLVNGVGYDSGNGGSWTFDGTNDYMVINHSDINYDRSRFSVEGWIKADTYHNNYDATLFSKWNTGAGNENEFIITLGSGVSGPSAGSFTVQSNDGSGSSSVAASSNYVIGEWYHIVGTFDNGIMRYFRNGVLQNQITAGFTTAKTQSTVPFKIGSFNQNENYFFDGKIAGIRMYSGKSLSVDEVAQNYNAQKTRFGL